MSTTSKNIQNKTTTIVDDRNFILPAVEAPKVPQHVICKELAEKGYKAKQVSEITGISYNNVAWYFSKYGLTKIANEKLKELFPEVTNTIKVDEAPKAPKVSKTIETKVETKIDPKKEAIKKVKKEVEVKKVPQRQSKK